MDTAGFRTLIAFFIVTLYASSAVSPLRAQEVELAFANFGQADEVCTSDGSGGYVCTDVSGESSRSTSVVAARFDADDHVDLVFSIDWEPNRICIGAADGSFTCSNVSADAHSSRDVAAADFNADGSMDVVFANLSQRNQVCLGDGEGGFSCGDLSSHVQSSAGIVAADFNDDGYPDIAVNNFGQHDLVCLNDGAAGFACYDPGTPIRKGQRITAEDLNRDRHEDLIIANQDQPNSVCLGDGSGAFTCSDVSTSAEPTFGVAAGDLNGDGAADLAFANAGHADSICLNDGIGSFTCSLVDPAVLFTLGVATTDVNGDDHTDLVFAVRDGRNRVCLGDGNGAFACGDIGPETESSVAVAAVTHGTEESADPSSEPSYTDSDGDGVEDADDACPGTVIPESVPTRRLLPNHFALADDDPIFDTYTPSRRSRGPQNLTTADTHGCSCEQIIEATGMSLGHLKYGCTIGILYHWMGSHRGPEVRNSSDDPSHTPPAANGDGAAHNAEYSSVSTGNYPNPFNPSTTIRVDLDEAGPLSLIVYDAMGREIDVLADGVYDAGVHEMTFRADHLPSGLYLYRLKTSRTVVQRSMTLLK